MVKIQTIGALAMSGSLLSGQREVFFDAD